VVEVPVRNQSLSACGFFHISTALFKERKRTKKKETAATTLLFLCLPNPTLNNYKMCFLLPFNERIRTIDRAAAAVSN
jgi:hypothetical protein